MTFATRHAHRAPRSRPHFTRQLFVPGTHVLTLFYKKTLSQDATLTPCALDWPSLCAKSAVGSQDSRGARRGGSTPSAPHRTPWMWTPLYRQQ